MEELAEWDRPATRGEAITFLDDARTRLPWYPTQTAIDWGFDETMPVVDGSTSTYPYTRAVYGALFWNYDNHPQFPESHSKSHESYERLINGEVGPLRRHPALGGAEGPGGGGGGGTGVHSHRL